MAPGIVAGWLADDDLRAFLGVHEAGGTTWLRAEPLATLAAWTLALATAEGGDGNGIGTALATAVEGAAEAGYALDRWRAALESGRGDGTARRATKGTAGDRTAPTGYLPRTPRGRRGDRTHR
jgi:hypothetical protein